MRQILADTKPRWKRVAEGRKPQVREDYRERLRAAVLQAASQLSGHTIENTIPSILASMGETLDVDRVSVLENGRGEEPGQSVLRLATRGGASGKTRPFRRISVDLGGAVAVARPLG